MEQSREQFCFAQNFFILILVIIFVIISNSIISIIVNDYQIRILGAYMLDE